VRNLQGGDQDITQQVGFFLHRSQDKEGGQLRTGKKKEREELNRLKGKWYFGVVMLLAGDGVGTEKPRRRGFPPDRWKSGLQKTLSTVESYGSNSEKGGGTHYHLVLKELAVQRP